MYKSWSLDLVILKMDNGMKLLTFELGRTRNGDIVLGTLLRVAYIGA